MTFIICSSTMAAICSSAEMTSGRNMLGGTELIRRKLGKDALCNDHYAADGFPRAKRWGKLLEMRFGWIPTRPAPYDFYQYWRNVGRCRCAEMHPHADLLAHGTDQGDGALGRQRS